jgi:hypothetical protein
MAASLEVLNEIGKKIVGIPLLRLCDIVVQCPSTLTIVRENKNSEGHVMIYADDNNIVTKFEIVPE